MRSGNRVVLTGCFLLDPVVCEADLCVGYHVLPHEVARYGSKSDVHLSVFVWCLSWSMFTFAHFAVGTCLAPFR